jgi:hypothetical protein
MKVFSILLFVLVIGKGIIYSQSQGKTLGKNSEDSKATVYFLRALEFPPSRINPIVYSN